MGCGTWLYDCFDCEKPVHEVCVDDFFMDRYPVTQAEYKKVMGSNPSRFKLWRHPVENVTWQEAHDFCTKVGKRLPTEAEWEYAARGGRKWKQQKELEKEQEKKADDITSGYAVCNGCGSEWDKESTSPVNAFEPNVLGLYDMLGNVYAWCADWYAADYYGRSPRKNPRGPKHGTQRAVRGRSWNLVPGFNTAWDRYSDEPDYREDDRGFRCVRSVRGR